MAINNEYEYMNEESIDRELICTICDAPFKDPKCTPCDHLFCDECIVQWIENHDITCPVCRYQPLAIDKLTKANRPLRNMLDRLEVKCTACGQKNLRRGEFRTHVERVCFNANVLCSAADIKCTWQGSRNQLEQHLASCAFESLRPVLKQLITENEQLKEHLNQQTATSGEHQHMIQQLIEYEREIELVRRELSNCALKSQRYQDENERLKEHLNQQTATSGEHQHMIQQLIEYEREIVLVRRELSNCALKSQRYQDENERLKEQLILQTAKNEEHQHMIQQLRRDSELHRRELSHHAIEHQLYQEFASSRILFEGINLPRISDNYKF